MEYDPTPDDIRSLREWIESIPYLPHNLEDHEFATYFRCFKGSLEKTKAFLDNAYYGRIKFPDLLTNYNPLSEGAQIDMKLALKLPLPKRTKDGSLIIVTKLTEEDLDFNPSEIFKMYTMMFKALVWEDQLKSGKVVFITDCKNMKFSQIKKMNPILLMAVAEVVTTIFPFRISAMHTIGLPQAAEWMVTMVKPLMKAKLAERLFLHKTPEELLEWYPKEILPADFGGEEENIKSLHEKFKAKLESYAPRFLQDELELRELDARRPSQPQEDILVGSFRKLEVD